MPTASSDLRSPRPVAARLVLSGLLVCAGARPASGPTAPATPASQPASRPANAAQYYDRAFAKLPDENAADYLYLISWYEAKTDHPRAGATLKRYREALEAFHWGAAATGCDWGPAVHDGNFTAVARVSPAWMLKSLAQFNARYLFEHGKPAEAFDEVARILAFGRHVGSEGVLAARESEARIVESVAQQVGTMLHATPPEVAKRFGARLKGLGPSMPWADAVRRQAAYVGPNLRGWAKDDPEKFVGPDGRFTRAVALRYRLDPEAEKKRAADAQALRALWLDPRRRDAAIEAVPPLVEQAARLLELPNDQFPAAAEAFQRQLEAHPLALLVVPDVAREREKMLAEAVHRAMLEAAVALRVEGPEAVSRYRDPAGDGPLELSVLEAPRGGGERAYELQSKLTRRIGNRPVVLRVGPPAKRAPGVLPGE